MSRLRYPTPLVALVSTLAWAQEPMVSNLVYALVWLHALDKNMPVRVEPNYFDR